MNIPAITARLSSLWTMIETPLANHLWQSTLFAAVAGLLALALKKNRAQIRYWLWFAASVKFLAPFSLLVWLGSQLRWSKPAAPAERLFFLIQEMGQPFAVAKPSHSAESVISRLLPELLLIAWLCGYVAVLCFWWLRWRRVTGAIRGATAARSGREFEVLRRLEQNAGMPRQIKLVASELAMEPGIIGIFRPVLLLPAGIAERLSDAQLEAIITHELCHVRRRDNLAAAVHMLVEAFFWFHPLIWWVGARLVDERERACDEDVLRLGSEPQVYAEGILKVCEFYLESPLACLAGVTGSNLKKRIEAIMVHHIASKLNLAKKLLLTATAAATLTLPVFFGLLHPASGHAQSQPATSAVLQGVSVRPAGALKPGDLIRTRFTLQNGVLDVKGVTLQHLIHYAYGVTGSQIAGAPEWFDSDLYDIDARTNDDVSTDRFKLAFRDLLSQQFKLAVHHELKNATTYELVVGRNGPKLAAATAKEKSNSLMVTPVGHLEATDAKITELVKFLQERTGRVVVDNTGLTGNYNFTLNAQGLAVSAAKDSDDISTLQRALSEQLGLELIPQTGMVDTLVIDHAEKVAGGSNSENGGPR